MTTEETLERLGAQFCHHCRTTTATLGYLRDREIDMSKLICYECSQNFRDDDTAIFSYWTPVS